MKGKRPEPKPVKRAAEFLLVGWALTFVYVTQLMSFGSGAAYGPNFVPLAHLIHAMRYGSAGLYLLDQMVLNVLIFIPLGFLCPVVFPRRMRSPFSILLLSLSVTVLTELVQNFNNRYADIDDVIMNTLGGLCGYALFIFCYGLVYSIRRRRGPCRLLVKRYRFQLAWSCVFLLCLSVPVALVAYADWTGAPAPLYRLAARWLALLPW
ncbi:MAG: VanZ family protein [Clostridiales bacterium]|nr:VanZ family protein [Clostridiales bacterium]